MRRAQVSRSLPAALVCGCLAIGSGIAGLTIAHAHPLWPWPLMAAFAAWTALAALRPGIALAGLFALLPLAGFAPRTGWLIFEELDLLILATAAGSYAAKALPTTRSDAPSIDRRSVAGPSIFALGLVFCYCIAMLVSMQRGMQAAGGFTFEWTQGFNGPLNSFRLFKGFASALLIAPLVQDELRRSAGFDRIGRGLTIGLGLASLAVVQERYAYIGLLDFSQDYRATGSFWEMHVGGATLDAFLLLTVPFAVREGLLARHHHARLAVVCAVVGLAAYATLSTFSRGLYFAIVVEAALLAIIALRRLLELEGLPLFVAVVKWSLFTIGIVVADSVVFRHGGYRGVIATLAVLAIALRVAPLIVDVRSRGFGIGAWFVSIVFSCLLGTAGYGVATIVPKGPYLVFALACVASIVAIVVAERHASRIRVALAVVAWLWTAVAACVVSHLWGGRAAGHDSAVVIGAFVSFVALAACFTPKLWQRNRKSQSVTFAMALLIVAPVTVLSAGTYMGDRLQSSRGDFQVRVDHWSEAIQRLRTTEDWSFGLGLGRYPASSIFSGGRSVPGSYRLFDRVGDRHVTLTAPGLPYLGDGEVYRFTQIVPALPDHRYALTIKARAKVSTTWLHVDLCEKHLIYSLGCTARDLTLTADPDDVDRWTTLTTTIDTGDLGRSPWYASKAIVFAMAVGQPLKTVDIGEVHLRGASGVDIIANGDFHEGTARWFSSSDMNHGPFHTFNLAVGVLVDQGLFGLGLLALLLIAVLVRTVLGRAHRHPDSAFVATSLIGLVALGLIDDPIDAPRIAFLFYSILLLGLMLRDPKAIAPTRSRDERPRPLPVAPTIDEAAARAKRRQLAFGTRRRIDRDSAE